MGSTTPDSQVFLMFGKANRGYFDDHYLPDDPGNGFIANQIKDILLAQGKNVIMSKARIESREQVLR